MAQLTDNLLQSIIGLRIQPHGTRSRDKTSRSSMAAASELVEIGFPYFRYTSAHSAAPSSLYPRTLPITYPRQLRLDVLQLPAIGKPGVYDTVYQACRSPHAVNNFVENQDSQLECATGARISRLHARSEAAPRAPASVRL